MTSKEIHEFIAAELKQGTKRAKIASGLRERAGADHLYGDFEAFVAQYALPGAARKYRALVNVFAVGVMLYGAFQLLMYAAAMRQFFEKPNNGGLWIVMQPLFALLMLLGIIEIRRMRHAGFIIGIWIPAVVGTQTLLTAPASAVIGFGIAVLGWFLRGVLFSHLTWRGKLK